MPIIRSLVKLAVGYAVTKALARSGGPAGLISSVLSGKNGHDQRTNRGWERTMRQKRADSQRRGH